jgi:putative transposase
MKQQDGKTAGELRHAEEGVAAGGTNDSSPAVLVIRTLRLKVTPEGYAWLNIAAMEVNTVWNWANDISGNAVTTCARRPQWLTGFDLNNLSSRGTECFEHIGADTIQRVNCEYALKRQAVMRIRLRWRTSKGPRRSLGWVPFKAANLKRKGRAVRFCKKTFRVFEPELLEGITWKQGCFAQDAVGDWFLCLPIEVSIEENAAPLEKVGIDLGLKDIAVTSDGDRCEKSRFYRDIEKRIAQAQRRGHRRHAKRLHRRAANRRKDALHNFSRKIVNQYQKVVVGDVSSLPLSKTRMAKSVLDSGWGMLKTQLQYKGQQAGRSVQIVSEKNTSRTCSACGSQCGPLGVNGLRVRQWVCVDCGESHDRDVNAARNILRRAEVSASVCGNEPPFLRLPPCRAPRSRKAGTRTARAIA